MLSGSISLIPGIGTYFWSGVVALIGVLAIGVLMLKYVPTEHDIVSFEMTFSVEKMKGYLSDWFQSGQIKLVIINTWLDFIWIVCYSVALFAFCRVIALMFNNMHVSDAFTVALFISFLPILAGLLDMLENIFLLYLLYKNQNGVSDGSVGEIPVFGSSIAAVVKFALVVISVAFLLAGIIFISIIKLGIIQSIALLFTIIFLVFIITKITGGKK